MSPQTLGLGRSVRAQEGNTGRGDSATFVSVALEVNVTNGVYISTRVTWSSPGLIQCPSPPRCHNIPGTSSGGCPPSTLGYFHRFESETLGLGRLYFVT